MGAQGEQALSPAHSSALADYSRFARRRREQCVAEVVAEFKETREMRLFDESYGKDEVEALLDGLLALVKSALQKELRSTANSSVLVLKQLLEQAENAGAKVSFDITRASDLALLREVEAWEASLSNGAGLQLKSKATGAAPKVLGSIGVVQDASTLMALEASKEDHASLVEKFKALQVQCSSILQERSSLSAKLEGLQAERAALAASAGGARSGLKTEAALQGRVAELEAEMSSLKANGGAAANASLARAEEAAKALSRELEEAREEIEARIEKSKQFANVRQMMAKKNEVIAGLRKQLKEHGILAEGDVVPSNE